MSRDAASERLMNLCGDLRLLVENADAHQHAAQSLLSQTEDYVAQCDASADAGFDQLQHFVRAVGKRTSATATAARRLRDSARTQHAAACRALRTLGGAVQHQPARDAVLVVEDHDDSRELVAHILRGAGFLVRTAANGLEGVFAAHEMRPHVIVMDVDMPILDGIEATRLIKADEATRLARVIAYTADSSLSARYRTALFADVLPKPADVALVLATVQRVARMSGC
jgi:CheY-like chemotaxis protein